MPTPHRNALTWPALDLKGRELPPRLTYERGIWGKAHAAATDFRWLATTPALAAPARQVELELPLGAADVPDKPATLWRTLGDTSYVVSFYPSQAIDAAGRSGFLEQQIIEWKRPSEVPAVVGALLLLPAVAQLDSLKWEEVSTEVRWSDDDGYPIALAADAPISVDVASVEEAVAKGLRALRAATSEEALAELYAALLAGGRAISLRDLSEPLSPAALAALLLPLPREIADQLSVAGWLPSTWLSDSGAQTLRRCWDIVLGGATALPRGAFPPPTEEQRDQARAMASEVFAGDINDVPDEQQKESKGVQLTLWGPSSAGKTLLLAKLFLEADQDANKTTAKTEKTRWEVFPTNTSHGFIKAMREQIKSNNRFPRFTNVGEVVGIEYVFKHPSGLTSSLQLEDRAGAESQELKDQKKGSLRERLGNADGLVLLFDPFSDVTTIEPMVWRALELVYLARGRVASKDERPIAICVSKTDIYIETPADLERALSAPDEFVRERAPEFLLRALDRYCANYRIFPISAAGVRLQYGVVEPAVFFDEALEPRLCPGGHPFNLMAPFTWLLNELTDVS
jgi:hypothetical protein